MWQVIMYTIFFFFFFFFVKEARSLIEMSPNLILFMTGDPHKQEAFQKWMDDKDTK